MTVCESHASLPSLVQRFFADWLIAQREASPHTVASYRDTFRLLLAYATRQLARQPTDLSVADIDADLVAGFLAFVEDDRKNSIRTRNVRRAAIRGFFRFVAIREPALLLHCQRVLAIPAKRQTKRTVDFLEREEAAALLAMPDLSTSIGRRDRNLLLVALQTGLRVSELTSRMSAAAARAARIGRRRCAATAPRHWLSGSRNEPAPRTNPCSRATASGASAGMESNGSCASTPGWHRRPARRWRANGSARTRCATPPPWNCSRAESAARSSLCGLATSQRKRRTSTCTPTCRSRNRRWIGQGRWKCPRESTGPTTSCWRSSTPFDLFYADNPTGAARSFNGLGRTVGIKRLSAYTGSCRYRHDPVERALRPVPLGKRNWLFASSEVGAQRVGIIQSLLVTCRLHEVDAYTYLVDVLQRISVHPASRAIELTPRMWKSLFADDPLRSDLGPRQHDPPPH